MYLGENVHAAITNAPNTRARYPNGIFAPSPYAYFGVHSFRSDKQLSTYVRRPSVRPSVHFARSPTRYLHERLMDTALSTGANIYFVRQTNNRKSGEVYMARPANRVRICSSATQKGIRNVWRILPEMPMRSCRASRGRFNIETSLANCLALFQKTAGHTSDFYKSFSHENSRR